MDATDQATLNSIRSDILDNVDAKYVVDDLIQSGVLTPDHDEEIGAEKTAKKRTEKLLDILPYTKRDALSHLRQALQDKYGFIVAKLDAVSVPDKSTSMAFPGSGGLRTAQAAVAAARGPTVVTGHAFATTRNNATSQTTNITGSNNFVVIGGNKTTINYH